MKKVTILFKSGNKLVLKCKVFELTINGDKRDLKMESNNYNGGMIDLNEIEAVTIVKCLF